MKVMIRNYKSLSISTSLIGCGHFVERVLVLNSDSAEDLWKKRASNLMSIVKAHMGNYQLYFYINNVIDLEMLLAKNLMN